MKTKLIFIAIAVLALAVVRTNAAFADTQKLSMDDALRDALSKSPLVAEIERNYAFKEADALEAGRLSNPSLDAEVALPRSWRDERGENEIAVSLTQPIKLSHGPLRNRLATLIEKAGSSAREQELLELTSKVRLSFARIWLLQQREAALGEIAPKTKSLTDFVSSGLSQGAYGKGDAAIFKSEIARTEAELVGLKAEKLQSQFELSKILGRSLDGILLIQPEVPKEVELSTIETRLQDSSLKLITRARTIVDLARADSDVANRDAFPELRPRIFYARSDAATNYIGFGISVDLPFYSRNSAERIRKTSELSASQAQLTFLQSEDFKRSVTNVARAFNLRRSEVEIYRARVIPNMEEALKAFEEQVRSGQGSVFQLWQTLQSYLETNERYLELWSKTFSDYTELSLLAGEEL